MSFRIAVDTGGTFSDVVVADAAGGELWVSKAPTTLDRVFDGISEALAYGASEHGLTLEQLLDQTSMFIYGTTRATNAIITGSTARPASLTTEGHPDTLVLREAESSTRSTSATTFEGHENPTRGVRGGGTGSPSDGWKYDREGNRVDIPMAAAMTIEPGERVFSRTGGGGSYGGPLTRDPTAVANDVREGWVSLDRGHSEYGLILIGDGIDPGGLVVDEPATRSEREERQR